MFCLQGKWDCQYNLQSDCFALLCAGTQYAWSLSCAHAARQNEKNETCVHLRLGTCVWHGGSHDKAALVSVRVFFDSDHRFEQTVDWSRLDENESDFAGVKKGPLLTR